MPCREREGESEQERKREEEGIRECERAEQARCKKNDGMRKLTLKFPYVGSLFFFFLSHFSLSIQGQNGSPGFSSQIWRAESVLMSTIREKELSRKNKAGFPGLPICFINY